MSFRPGELVRLLVGSPPIYEPRSLGHGSDTNGSRKIIVDYIGPMMYIGKYSNPNFTAVAKCSLPWNAQVLCGDQIMITRLEDLEKFETEELG